MTPAGGGGAATPRGTTGAPRRPGRAAALAAVLPLLAALPAQAADEVVVWHSYRGAERDGLDAALAAWNAAHPEAQALAQAIPNEAISYKLEAAIPHGNGPDLFVFAHERVEKWTRAGLIAPPEPGAAGEAARAHTRPAVDALTVSGKLVAWPLASKCLALYHDPSKVPEPPATTVELLDLAARLTDRGAGRFGLAYEVDNFYFHAAFLHGYGGSVFGPDGAVALDSKPAVEALAFVHDLARKAVPDEPTGALVAQLFGEGRAAMVISGPWFLGELPEGRPVRVSPLPTVSSTGEPLRPFLTVEGAFVSGRAARPADAARLAAFLSQGDGARIRALGGGQTVTALAVQADPEFGRDPLRATFAAQASRAVPMPTRSEMDAVWEPANQSLRKLMRGDLDPEGAARFARRRTEIVLRPDPPRRSPALLLGVAGVVTLSASFHLLRRARGGALRAAAARAFPAWFYVAPALIGLLLISFVPFAVGAAVSLFAHRGGEYTYVGLANFADVLLSRDYGLLDPLSFWATAAVTVAWTAANVSLHVAIGLGLALLLRDPWVRLRGLWRVLLVVPWAVPNYITALIWKGMFHRQFGAVNALLVMLGLEPVSWFARFSTAFSANLATNTWLGFPFMMVVTLGALQAIPRDLEEAASVDGASRWQRFRHVTLPLLLPALLPAVVLGSVWTFNQFNIVYLVSGGEPDGSTDILISQAYKWAFERQARYGYAAAYSLLIFGLLFAYSRFTDRLLARVRG